ncbi:hypothetical protein NLG97_g4194 [Lecanicillium saksenae]|uniref:Uncharacterized protein n=1 Tax=Lecanicillium saksenae TaxID=468837 RepID=A0ACC1QVZ2_9HYPO|nr:hypothetical protein NLG97_g4194 [Lecanicillium saksenae]
MKGSPREDIQVEGTGTSHFGSNWKRAGNPTGVFEGSSKQVTIKGGASAQFGFNFEHLLSGGRLPSWTDIIPPPSAFYGINSKNLGRDKIDGAGLNKGLFELATSQEVVGYYNQLMSQHFLPSGRVSYFSQCEYTGDGKFHSLLTGEKFQIGERARIVDATFMKVSVPAMIPPAYEVAPGVKLIAPNELVKLPRKYANYIVIGAGKTGIDACLWFLGNGVDPSDISWIMPRDSWLLDREAIQPRELFAKRRFKDQKSLFLSATSATSVAGLFKDLESSGQLMRLTDKVWPSMYRCATVSRLELEEIRRIQNVIRMGRVIRVERDEIQLQKGVYKPNPDILYINCTADGLAKLPTVPVFNGRYITLQSVRVCQQVFSASFIAHVDATYDDEKPKNELCCPIPHPYKATDWMTTVIKSLRARKLWNSHPKTAAWLLQARLNVDKHHLPDDPEGRAAVIELIDELGGVMATKLTELLSTLPANESANAKAQISKIHGSIKEPSKL